MLLAIVVFIAVAGHPVRFECATRRSHRLRDTRLVDRTAVLARVQAYREIKSQIGQVRE